MPRYTNFGFPRRKGMKQVDTFTVPLQSAYPTTPRIRYVGREPIHFGKSLFEICARLGNSGHDRLVTRTCAEGKPDGGRHFRLTKCVYDLTPVKPAEVLGRKKQTAKPEEVLYLKPMTGEYEKGDAFGVELGPNAHIDVPVEIKDAHELDWKLIPKMQEAEFVSKLNNLPKIYPKRYTPNELPPILKEVLKRKL